MSFKQSVVLPIFHPQHKLTADLLDPIVEIGFPAIEIWSRDPGYENVFEAARSRGLTIASMVGHEHSSPISGSHSEALSRRHNHDRVEAELRESIDIAVKWGIPGLIALSGHRNPGESDYETLLVCAEGLRRIAPYAEEKGININIELLNSSIDHPHYVCDRTDWAIALCELVDSPRVKILYDVYHMSIMEGNLIRSLRRAAKWIGHYHTAGNPGRNDLDDEQEINYRGVCRAIRETGYDGFLAHEFSPKGDVVAALKSAFNRCKL